MSDIIGPIETFMMQTLEVFSNDFKGIKLLKK